MKISASIVTYKTPARDLERVLESALSSPIEKLYIIDHSPGREVESFFMDSTEEASSALSRLLTDGRVVYERHPNRGYGAGHNIAIRESMHSGYDYHAVLNPDIYWDDQVISVLSDYMECHPEVGMMAPKVLYPDGRLQKNCKLLPTPLDSFGRRFLPKRLYAGRNERYELGFADFNEIMNVPYLTGCFMLIRNRALKGAGLFDERFFMYPEDIDLTRRLHKKYHTLYYPDVKIYHRLEQASGKSLKMFFIHIYNMMKYYFKWGWWIDPERRRFNRRVIETYGKK
ncbi:MAG: glycosyltransferase family 2 protein [Muribaculaceae bacterium]|nr:glycosyltransferase family 2 protein [Muribaculaceae bacterium]